MLFLICATLCTVSYSFYFTGVGLTNIYAQCFINTYINESDPGAINCPGIARGNMIHLAE